MKRLSIFVLALAFAVTFAVPAMAVHEGSLDTGPPPPGMEEGWAMYGDYTFDMTAAESFLFTPTGERKWYDDELQFVIKVDRGPVTATVDMEISDDETFDGTDVSTSAGNDIVDNYFIEYDASARAEGLSFKVGEYGNSFARKVAIYSEGGHQIGVRYSVDFGDLALYIGKIDEGNTNVDDDDVDMMTFTANLGKQIDFFKKLNFIFITADTNAANEDYGYTGIDAAFDLGPVPVALEWGSISDDDATGNDGGSFFLFDAGLDEFVGFDLNVGMYSSDEEFGEGTFGANDYYPLDLYGFRSGVNGGLSDVTIIMVSSSYAVSDFVTLKGKVATIDEGSTLSDDSAGTEIDLAATLKWAGNVSTTVGYSVWSVDGSYSSFDDPTRLRARTVFKF